MDLELLIDKIDFSQGARQIAKQALELGMKCQKVYPDFSIWGNTAHYKAVQEKSP